jgi:hypothetical protein
MVNKQKLNDDTEEGHEIKYYKSEFYGMTENKMLQPGTKKYHEKKNWQERGMRRLWKTEETGESYRFTLMIKEETKNTLMLQPSSSRLIHVPSSTWSIPQCFIYVYVCVCVCFCPESLSYI